jgi:6-phosphogluconolactonase
MIASGDWRVLPDVDVVAQAAADAILEAAVEALAARGSFSLVLAGGRTPLGVYRLLAERERDLDGWEIFFGDERCLPPTDPERNSAAAEAVWLVSSGITPTHVHTIPAEQGPELAAALYAEEIAAWQPFDLVLLGLGEDGHVASLFPGQEHAHESLVVPVHSAPKPPPERVSLNYGTLCGARRRLLLATGKGKRAALAAARRGEDLPVTRLAACGPLTVLLDAAAAPRA